MITNYLYLYKHDLNDIGIYLSKQKRTTYKIVKLFKQDEINNA